MVGAAMLAFNDLGLTTIGGPMTASPAWAFLLVAAVLAPPGNLKLNRVARLFVSFTVVVTIVSLFATGGGGAWDERLDKGVRLTVTVVVWLVIFCKAASVYRTWRRQVVVGLAIALTIMVASAALQTTNLSGVDGVSLLHGTSNLQQRIRGTRFEASALGAGIIVVAAGLLAAYRGRIPVVLVASISVGALYVTESRGTVATAVAIVGVSVIVVATPDTLRQWLTARAATALSLTVLSVSFWLDALLRSGLWLHIGLERSGTSDATRSVWAATSVQSVIHYPLGMGYARYLDWLPPLLAQVTSSTQYRRSELSEIIQVSYLGSDDFLSPKVLPGILAIHAGVVGLVLVFFLWRQSIISAADGAAAGYQCTLVATASLMIVAATYYSSVFAWEQAFIGGAILLKFWEHEVL